MKKNRVAIATWTGITSLNYGSTLQSVALQELIKKCGYSPRTINYCPQYEKNRFRCYIKRETQLLNKGKKYLKTYMTFQRYMMRYLKCSSICYNFKEITHYVKKNCSILLSGSDAVWWEGWMHSDWIGPLFLWKLPGLESYPKIAYAPSLLMGEIADELKDELSKYNSISVREKSSYDKIVNIIDRDITVVLDPVLTVPESFWNNQATKRLIDEEYVLAYFCSEAEMHHISIQQIQDKYNTEKVVYIDMNFVDKKFGISDYKGNEYSKIVGPAEFLSLIKYAKAVCTDSFHGVITSIVFRREFYIFDRNSEWNISDDCRFQDIMHRLHIENRVICKNRDIDIMKKIDYQKVEKYLLEEREKSFGYLKKSLEQINGGKKNDITG